MANVVEITVTGDNKSAKAAVEGAQADVKKLGQTVNETGSLMKQILAADLIRDAGAKVSEFVKDSVKAASDLEQSVGGTEAVFKDLSGVIDDFAKTSAESVGLSENSFREYTTMIGGQLKRMTGDLGAATDMTLKMTKVAADLSATYGGTTKEAMEAFSAALRGEADPAERFNLNLKVGVIQAKAVEMGLAKTTSQVSQAAQAQAMYALIMEQSQDALGQFNRESDTFAHRQQVANAEIENAKAAFGQALLPVMGKAAEILGDLAKGFGALPGPVQAAIAIILGLSAAVIVLTPRLVAAKVALQEMGVTAKGAGAMLAGPWGMAITAAIALLGAFSAKHAEAKALANEFSEAINYQNLVMDDANRQLVARKLEEEGLLEAGKKLGYTEKELVDIVLGNAEAFKKFDDATKGLPGGMGRASTEVGRFSEGMRELAKGVKEGEAATKRKTAAVGADTQATKDNTQSIEEQIAALKKQASAISDQFDPMAKLIHAQQTVTEKQAAYNKEVKKHGKDSAEAKKAELDYAAAVIDAGSAAANASGAFDGKLSPALRQILKDGRLTEAQIRDIEKQFIAARKEGDRYAKTYNATANLKVIVHDAGYVEYRADERKPGKHAYGGITSGNAIINDWGSNPGELIKTPDGSVVIPHGQSTQMLSNMIANIGGGGSSSGAVAVEMSMTSGLWFLDALIAGIQYKVRTDGRGDVNYLAGH